MVDEVDGVRCEVHEQVVDDEVVVSHDDGDVSDAHDEQHEQNDDEVDEHEETDIRETPLIRHECDEFESLVL